MKEWGQRNYSKTNFDFNKLGRYFSALNNNVDNYNKMSHNIPGGNMVT